MRKALTIALIVLGLGVVLAAMGWALYASRSLGSWTGGSPVILIMMVAGTLLTGALTGGLMWLAFYSERKGYDEPFRLDSDDSDKR
jgi:hypothetical protein